MLRGIDVQCGITEMALSPPWLHTAWGLDWSNLTIAILPAYFAVKVPGRQWLWVMTEGSELPDGWAEKIRLAAPERLIVPCEYNAEAFREGMLKEGFSLPIHVIPGGTDPAEFPRHILNGRYQNGDHQYTFLSLGDRGARKGWTETWDAFYRAFGTPDDTPDVRLIIKSRPKGNEMLDMIAKGSGLDPRITIWQEDIEEMRDVYSVADCISLPSRSEGWGMPHREAAMMGIPVITQQYGGVDDGYTSKWSLPIDGGRLERMSPHFKHIKGEWLRPDPQTLAEKMRWCYENPNEAAEFGQSASKWLEENQTWDHTALALLDLIEEYS